MARVSQALPAAGPNGRGYIGRVSPRYASVAVLLGLLVPAGVAAGATASDPPIASSRHLWATVNACDTAAHPNAIGVRGSMPGSGISAERMFMRFQVQYVSTVDNRWHNLLTGGDSGFVAVGSARYKARQAGHFFVFAPPAGRTYELRGVVTFEWRRRGEVVRRARERTSANHPSVADADPPRFSAATCRVG